MATVEGVWFLAEGDLHDAALQLRRLGRRSAEVRGISSLEAAPASAWKFAAVPAADIACATRAISNALSTRCMGVAVQTVVDAFGFWLFDGGQESRRLVYGLSGPEERTWEEVEGTAEPWEQRVLWGPSAQESVNWLPQAERVATMERIERREIVLGSGIPSLETRRALTAMLEHYAIPPKLPLSVPVGPAWPLREFRIFW